MSEQVALTILQLVALAFTADVMLLKLISDSSARYPDKVVRRAAIAAALIILSGVLAAIYILVPVAVILNLSVIAVILSLLSTLATLYPLTKVEKVNLEEDEEIEL